MIKQIQMEMKGINVNLPLKPITLLFGPNSSGKSSVIQSLLFLHHAVNTGDADVHHPLLGGNLVDLGGINRFMRGIQNDIHIWLDVSSLNESIRKYFIPKSIIYVFLVLENLPNSTPYLQKCEIVNLVEPIPQEDVVDGVPRQDKYSFLGGEFDKVTMYDMYNNDFYKTGSFYINMERYSNVLEDGAYGVASLQCDSFIIPNLLGEIFSSSTLSRIREIYPEASSLADKPKFMKKKIFLWEVTKFFDDLHNKKYVLDSDGEPLVDPLGIPIESSFEYSAEEMFLLEHEAVLLKYCEIEMEIASSLQPDQNLLKRFDELSDFIGDIIFPESRISDNILFQTNNFLPVPKQDIVVKAEQIINFLLADECDSEKAIRTLLQQVAAQSLCDCLKGISEAVINDLNRLRYLGPIRAYPDRFVGLTESKDIDWYASGNFAWQEIKNNKKVRDKVNQWLGAKDRLQTPYEFLLKNYQTVEQFVQSVDKAFKEKKIKVNTSSLEIDNSEIHINTADLSQQINHYLTENMEASPLSTLVLIDKIRNIEVTHRDVGFGISQVLPVLVESFGNQEKIIAIEQPELHLHPGLQAELGDVFIESALGENKNTFVLETHSEHLILRILRRIRETTEGELPEGAIPITPDDVCVLYAEPTEKGSKLKELKVDKMGEFIDSWPGGFFTERAKELF